MGRSKYACGGDSALESPPRERAASTADRENRMQQRHGLDELRGQGGMDWIEEEKGWVAAACPLTGPSAPSLDRDTYRDDGGEG